jgi:endonuclease/exonuclease/phosphatase family metal-dependent hydrolase
MFKGLGVFSGIVYLLNLGLVLVLLLSYCTVFVSPAMAPKFAILGLLYPVWLVGNLLFILFWLLQLRRQALTSIVAILIGYPFFLSTIQLTGSTDIPEQMETFRLMTFNARKYNFYEWVPDRKEVAGIVEKMVQREMPDVILIQEHINFWGTPQFKGYQKYVYHDGSKNTLGFAIYSRFPIIRSGYESYGLGHHRLVDFYGWSDIVIAEDTLRFLNVHLASIGLPVDDYGLLNNPSETSQQELKRDLRDIVRKMWEAYKWRGQQVPVLIKAIQESPYPVILCGDINDPPVSYAAFQIGRKLQDSFRNSGQGLSGTYAKSKYPFRIDYIFHPKRLKSFNHRVITDVYSDHYPVVVDIEKPRNNP